MALKNREDFIEDKKSNKTGQTKQMSQNSNTKSNKKILAKSVTTHSLIWDYMNNDIEAKCHKQKALG